jgi:hypothetical protein
MRDWIHSWLLPVGVVAILLASSYRFWTVATGPIPPGELFDVRQAVASWLASTSPLPIDEDGRINIESLDASLIDLGVIRIELQRFDAEALVVIRPGSDGQPGVAGVDDNGDAVIDNRSELGATRSDDRCEVIPSQSISPSQETRLVLQRGAFIPATTSAAKNSSVEQRAVVIGRTDQQLWSFLMRLSQP